MQKKPIAIIVGTAIAAAAIVVGIVPTQSFYRAYVDGLTTGSGSRTNPIDMAISVQPPIAGVGSAGSPLSLTVSTDSTITGTGSAGSPLSAVNVSTSTVQLIEAALFGDGSDGDVTIAAGTTTLTRDMFYDDLSISSGAVLRPDGFRVFVRGTLTLDGLIHSNGGNGSGTAAGGGAYVSGSRPLSTGNTAGGGGSSGCLAPGPGSSNATAPRGFSNSGGAAGITNPFPCVACTGGAGTDGGAGKGGGGGAGGNNSGGASAQNGEAAGTVGVSSAAHGDLRALLRGSFDAVNLNYVKYGAGGTGGGGGGCGGTNGGGGGGGGGIVFVAARYATGSGSVQAKGGNGGNGSGAIGGGGGGGGGGGVVVLIIGSGSTPTTSVVGGTKGNGGVGSGGHGNGGAGGNGGNGITIIYKLSV